MKIKIIKKSYEDVNNLPPLTSHRKKVIKQSRVLAFVIRFISFFTFKKVHFKVNTVNMDKKGKKEACLYLMNHSSFIDLKIAFKLIKGRFNIVCTNDAFVNQELLLRLLGCIPTNKFVFDPMIIRDMKYVKDKLNNSILMYPEASYSFDGKATPLPTNLGKFIKLLNMPIVTIITKGAFLRDPLYNNLQIRKTNVSCEMKYLLSLEDIKNKSVEEIDEIINKEFSFDNFKDQQNNHIKVKEPFRADYLNRVLYKCASCGCEGKMEGKGITLHCENCDATYELDEYGKLIKKKGSVLIEHIPDWYEFERQAVKQEILNGTYNLDLKVQIYIMKDYKAIYNVGTGKLVHNIDGFTLKGDNNSLFYQQKSTFNYSLYSDFNWYEVGDIICIGDEKVKYYCVPLDSKDVVAKARLATEEIYKIIKTKAIN